MDRIAQFWGRVERKLMPYLEERLPALTKEEEQLALVLEMVRPEEYVRPSWWQRLGRARKDRKALTRIIHEPDASVAERSGAAEAQALS